MNSLQSGIILQCVFVMMVIGQPFRGRGGTFGSFYLGTLFGPGGFAGGALSGGGGAQTGNGAPRGAAWAGMDMFRTAVAARGAGAAGIVQPRKPGRPLVSGMDANLVADLMGGRPGPLPIDIAQEAAELRAKGWTSDQISDTLGDKMQLRFNVPIAKAAGSTTMSTAPGGAAGMDANLVAELMEGRPGPLPMDIAQEAAELRARGWTSDQISDTLGDKMQLRFSNLMAAVA